MSETDREFLSLLKMLLAVGSPSGREEKTAAVVRTQLTAIGYPSETDGAGNVIVRVEGRDAAARPCIFAAHMDEIGIVVTDIAEDGILSVDRSGKLSPHKIGERPLEIIGDRHSVTGVLSFGSGHVAAGEKDFAWSQMRVITGLSRQALAKAGVRPGSTGVPISEGRGPVLLGESDDPLVAAWTLDDRAGVAVLLQVLRKLKEHGVRPPCPGMFAFTIHEEGGCHGAKVLAQRERPEFFFAIDGCPWTPGAGVAVNERPTAFSKDMLAHYDQRLIGTLMRAARAAQTELQVAVLSAAFSDASAVYNLGAAPRVATLGHTRYNSHGFEVARLGVFSRVVDTIFQLVRMPEW